MTKGAWINEEGVLVVDMAEADKLWNSMTQDQQYRAMCAMFDPLVASATDLKKQVEALEARVAAADKLAEWSLRIIDGYGFTADGNDTWREVAAVDLDELETALAAYEATK